MLFVYQQKTKIIEIVDSYNKANLKTGNFLPHIVNPVARAKNLDRTQKDYQTIVGSHLYKVIEKLK